MKSNIIVVGGGPVGAFSSYFLNERGYRVKWITGKDQKKSAAWSSAGLVGPGLSFPLPAYESLRGNLSWLFKRESPVKMGAGFFLSHMDWFSTYARSRDAILSSDGIKSQMSLTMGSMEIIKELSDKSLIKVDLKQNGLLQLFENRNEMEKIIVELKGESNSNVKYSILNHEECMEKYPELKCSDCQGIFYPEEAALNPQKLLSEMRRLNRAGGVEIIEDDITGIRMKGNTISSINTESGEEMKADIFLMSAGTRNSDLSREMGLRIPVVPGWGHSIVYENSSGSLEIPVEIAEHGVYAVPTGNAVKVTSFFEFRGESFRPPESRFEFIESILRKYLPEVAKGRIMDRSSGMRPCTPDSLAIAGQSSKINNLYWATGNCRQGVMHSGEMGNMIGMIMDGENIPSEYGVFSPVRFGL